jgi:thiosulfate/3-mercaptopyruvate sulfurtransferase
LKKEILIFKDEIQASLDSHDITIVDARPIGQFSGKTKDHNSERKGHIPGAVNIPFSSLSPGEAPYLFKSEKELLDLFEEKGILRESRVLVYCGSGIWASPVYFALRLLGYHVRFYDGSFQEWGNELSLPVALSDEI